MLERDTIKHPIERAILTSLITYAHAKFSDIRPSNIDTNLFTYHLKLLVKSGYVTKTDQGYTLSSQGLNYIDRVNGDSTLLRVQPKIVIALLVQDGYGNVLLQKRALQPYIDSWGLPSVEMRIDDASMHAAAQRSAAILLGHKPDNVRHVGDCYVVVGTKSRMHVRPGEADVFVDGDVLHLATKETFDLESRTLVHVMRFESDGIVPRDDMTWVEPLNLTHTKTTPGTEEIVTRAFFGDDFFFEEFIVGN